MSNTNSPAEIAPEEQITTPQETHSNLVNSAIQFDPIAVNKMATATPCSNQPPGHKTRETPETQWSFKNIPIANQDKSELPQAPPEDVVGDQDSTTEANCALDGSHTGKDKLSEKEWSIKDLYIDRNPQPASLEFLTLELQQEILSRFVDRNDPVHIDVTNSGLKKAHFKNGVPQVFQDLNGLFRINQQIGKMAREWVFDKATFTANETGFQHFPAIFGLANTEKIKHLHLHLDACIYNDGDRPKLLKILIDCLPQLETLEVTEGPEWSAKQLSRPADIVGGRHKSHKFVCRLSGLHPKLNRVMILPHVVKGNGYESRYRLETGSSDRLSLWKTSLGNSTIFGDRKEPLILNATMGRRMQIDALRRARYQDISIHLGPNQTMSSIVSSEVPDPSSHYAAIDKQALLEPVGSWPSRGSNDDGLLKMCREVDEAAHPTAYLMEQWAIVKRQLEESDEAMRDLKTESERLQVKLNEEYSRRSETSACVAVIPTGKHKLRQFRNMRSDIARVMRDPEPWSDSLPDTGIDW